MKMKEASTVIPKGTSSRAARLAMAGTMTSVSTSGGARPSMLARREKHARGGGSIDCRQLFQNRRRQLHLSGTKGAACVLHARRATTQVRVSRFGSVASIGRVGGGGWGMGPCREGVVRRTRGRGSLMGGSSYPGLSVSRSAAAAVRAAATATAELAAAGGDEAAVTRETPEEEEEEEEEVPVESRPTVSFWKDAMPANDDIDKQILKLFVPAMLNFLIIPLVGAVDVFWIGRMGSAVALAAQGAANQVFQSAFWIISFVPSVIAPVVAKAAASKDTEEVQRAVGEAIFVSSFVGLIGMLLLTGMQDQALRVVNVVPGSATALEAAPYIGWRALTFIPAIISTVGFAAFRGTLDVTTPMKITLLSQMINVILDPILIFGAGAIKAMGVVGAAVATSASEVTSCSLYITTMLKRKLITVKSMFAIPSPAQVGKLMVGGAAVQLRSIAQNITFLAVMRAILTMDATGTAAAAHTVSAQMFQLGVIAILALSTLAAILIPQRINAAEGKGGLVEAKKVADRLLMWGFILGCFLGCLQACALPMIKYFTPLQGVQDMAKLPVLIGAVQMPLNGLVFVCEGLMQGHQAFLRLAGGMFVSTALMMGALSKFGGSLEGVWLCFFVFNFSRLAFGLRHHLVDGPLAPHKIRAVANAEGGGDEGEAVEGAVAEKPSAPEKVDKARFGFLGNGGVRGKDQGNGWVLYKFD